jgi:signal transduction histidine kinase
MRIRPLKSLSVKLGLMLFVVVAVAMGITYAAVVPRLESRLVSSTLDDLRQSAGVISGVARQADSQYGLQQLAYLFQEQLNARIVFYQDVSDTLLVVADSSSLDSASVANDRFAREALESGSLAQGRVDRDGRQFAEIARPIDPARSRYFLLISAPLADRLSAVHVVKRDILIFGGVALAVSWLVGVLAALKFTRRIKRLETAAERIASGDFEAKIVDPGEDEVGQLARTFDRMRVRLSSLDRARREFVANASHELRTPLFALGGFLELLSDEDLDEGTRRDFVETARGQVDRLTRLATDLLDLSRLDAGQLALEPEPIDLVAEGQELVEEFRGLAEGSGHELRAGTGGEVTALGDEERVRQVGRALLENALRHTPAGTTIEVDASVRGQEAVLVVCDDGPGIPAEDQERLFERFYRGAGGAAFGSGLGLAIAQELAVLMGGGIELESYPGETRFALVLPRASAPAPFSRENALTRS